MSVIEEANWLTLPEDIPELIGDGFDALICMGNSFAHLPDFGGEQQVQQFKNLQFRVISRLRIVMHLKTSKYACKYALKSAEICT